MNNINDQNGNENINYLLKFSHVILEKIIYIVKKLFFIQENKKKYFHSGKKKYFSFWKIVFSF